MAKEKPVMEITDKFLESLYERCDGRRSHFLILTDELPEFLDFLVKEGWITLVKNTEKRPWYMATVKLITKFRELGKAEKAQLDNLAADQAAELAEFAAEDERAQEVIDERKEIKL
jgi:hypothetical protein